MKYLRDSFAYADRVVATINARNALAPVSGPYGGPSTKLGIAVLPSGTPTIITCA